MSPSLSDLASPGGWLRLLNTRIGRWLIVGTLSLGGGAAAFYGQFQGGQASHFIEARLVSAAANTVTYSALNPLQEGMSGAIAFNESSFVFISEAASPVTRVSVCTATGAAQPCKNTAGSSNVMSGVYLSGTNRLVTTSQTGAVLVAGGTPAILAPRNYGNTARKYLNFTFITGTGQTASGLAPAFARIEVVPCNLDGVGC